MSYIVGNVVTGASLNYALDYSLLILVTLHLLNTNATMAVGMTTADSDLVALSLFC